MVIGALAFQVAAKTGGRVTGTRGALNERPRTTIRPYLLLVVVVGLLGYAAWRILQGLFDPGLLECPHDCPCGRPKPRLQSQCQPSRLIGEVTGSEDLRGKSRLVERRISF